MAGSTETAPEKAETALDTIAAVAPPEAPAEAKEASAGDRKTPEVREAHDAETHSELKRDPTHADRKLDVELDESFPGSDAPSTSRPGSGDPAPSSGYDPEAEKALAKAG